MPRVRVPGERVTDEDHQEAQKIRLHASGTGKNARSTLDYLKSFLRENASLATASRQDVVELFLGQLQRLGVRASTIKLHHEILDRHCPNVPDLDAAYESVRRAEFLSGVQRQATTQEPLHKKVSWSLEQ